MTAPVTALLLDNFHAAHASKCCVSFSRTCTSPVRPANCTFHRSWILRAANGRYAGCDRSIVNVGRRSAKGRPRSRSEQTQHDAAKRSMAVKSPKAPSVSSAPTFHSVEIQTFAADTSFEKSIAKADVHAARRSHSSHPCLVVPSNQETTSGLRAGYPQFVFRLARSPEQFLALPFAEVRIFARIPHGYRPSRPRRDDRKRFL